MNIAAEALARLRALADPANVEGMARFGISSEGTLGVSMPQLRTMARDLKKSDATARHELAGELWASGIHEARILAALVDVPSLVDDAQMERWVAEFDSWDVCDQVCATLFDKTPVAYEKAVAWASRQEEFVKRAGFALMAALAWHDTLAWHDKAAPDGAFEAFLPVIEEGSLDDRNFVKKAVNWALRQVGKRDARLNTLAVAAAERIAENPSRAARWVAKDALRELTSEAVQARLKGG